MASVLFFFAVVLARAHAGETAANPISQVLGLLGELKAKIQADGERELNAYHEYIDWCGRVEAATRNDIKTQKLEKGSEEADIEESASTIESAQAKIEKTAAEISEGKAELDEAAAIREKERAEFLESEKKLTNVLETIDRAMEKLRKADAASLMQIAKGGVHNLITTIGLMVEAASLTSLNQQRLVALAQTRTAQGAAAEEDYSELGAPASAVYESKSGNVVELLEDLKEKAVTQLSELRKAEASAQHEFDVLRQSLINEAGADKMELTEEKTRKMEALEEKTGSEGELEVLLEELPKDERNLEDVEANCAKKEADHEATTKSREEELRAVDEAAKIIKESTGGATEKSYSLFQLRARSKLRTRADLAHVEALAVVKRLAHDHHSAALAQLAAQMSAIMHTSAVAGADPFAKIKGLIKDLISKLEAEASSESTEKAYCDDEMSKTTAKKDELTEDLDKVTSKLDKATGMVAQLKEDVSELQAELAKLASSQAEIDRIRKQSHEDYVESKADLERGLTGVRKALGVLREYYSADKGSAAMLQTGDESGEGDAALRPEKHNQASGAGTGIISMLEVCESDFANNLAKEEAEESDAVEDYDKVTQDNKVSSEAKSTDVKLKTKKYTSLEKQITEHKTDREGLSSELDAVLEYDTKLKDRCIGKPDSYEERRARRDAEINGLKEALKLLSAEASFTQRSKHVLSRASGLVPDQS